MQILPWCFPSSSSKGANKFYIFIFGHFNKFTRITYKWLCVYMLQKHQALKHFITMHTYDVCSEIV